MKAEANRDTAILSACTCVAAVAGLLFSSASGLALAQSSQQDVQLDFQLSDTMGRTVSADDYRGIPLLLEFGACWCGGCQEAREPTIFVRAADRNLIPGESTVVSGKHVDATPVVVHSRGRTGCAYSSQCRRPEPDRYRKTLALTTVEVNENVVAAKQQRYFGDPTSNCGRTQS